LPTCLHFVVRGREPNSVTSTNSSQPIVYQITYSVLEPPAAPWWRGRIAHLPFPWLSSGFSWVHPLPIYSRFPSAYPSSRLAYDPLPPCCPVTTSWSIRIESFTCMPLKKLVVTCVPLKSLFTPLYHRLELLCPLRHSVDFLT
jgi:hypothetical protein